MDSEFLKLEKLERTRIIYLNAPPANGLNLELIEELDKIISYLKQEGADICCLILTSHIKNIFIAGADIKMIKNYMDGPNLTDDMIHFNTRLQETINEIEDLPFPVVAALNGHAMGGGLELALACDFRFMAIGKARVGLPEVDLGLLPGAGGTQRLSRLIGKSRAKHIIFHGKLLDAETALSMGVVDRIYKTESLMTETLKFADELKDRAGISISVVKRCINQGSNMSLKDGLAIEMKGLERLLNTADAKEGVTAFLEKRKPFFQSK